MAGLNYGNKYTFGRVPLSKRATGGSRILKKVDVYSSATRLLLYVAKSIKDASYRTRILESSIIRNMKTNSCKSIEDCKECQGFIFKYNNETIF